MNRAILILLTLNLTACGFEIVDTGYRGIQTRFGEIQGEPLPEGLHFYSPFTSDIVEYQVREDKYEDETVAFTKDTQQVKIKFAAVWAPNPKQVHTLYKDVGRTSAVEENILKPSVLGSLKDAIGMLVADELVSKRDVATKAALESVRESLKERHIFVTDLQFTDLDFDDQYEKAVEEKAVALQLSQKAKNETVMIAEQSKQVVLQAQAAAESMKIKSEALSKNKGLVEFELAQRWDGKLPTYMMGDAVPFIDIKATKKP